MDMPSLIDLMLEGRKVGQHGPWPRVVGRCPVWNFAASELAHGRWSLLGLWGEPATVHMAIIDEQTAEIAVSAWTVPIAVILRSAGTTRRHCGWNAPSTICSGWCRRLARRPPLARSRPLGHAHPVGRSHRRIAEAGALPFPAAEGDGLHQIAVGPVHAGIIEPGHFRFTASGETVVRLEERLGYVHKGIEGLMAGASLERAAQLAGRISGDSTVAYAYAFSQAAEAALDLAVPDRARSGCARCWRNWSGSPIISATSARSATMPPSR